MVRFGYWASSLERWAECSRTFASTKMKTKAPILFGFFLVACDSPEQINSPIAEAGVEIAAIKQFGHDISIGSGLSKTEGYVAVLTGRTGGIHKEDAILLSQVPNLTEIRVLPRGGASEEFWTNLSEIKTLADFAAHYGLSETGIRSLSKFPNIQTLTIWGQSTRLSNLPRLPKLRLLHIEESKLSVDDIRQIKTSCPALEEFHCDFDLEPHALELLRSIPTLKSISAGDYEIGRITAQ